MPKRKKINAIETRYAGCRFRSRTEARWAVFLDHLDIAWHYEPEGFEVTSGRYLPDFYLPEFQKWIEVKPTLAAISHNEWQRMQDFGNEVALPENKFSIVFAIPDPHKKPSPLIWTVSWTGPLADKALPVNEELADGCGHIFAGFIPSFWMVDKRSSVQSALSAARSARFEHGESG
jgi:hypothetical protein